jgi:hypothetical protein
MDSPWDTCPCGHSVLSEYQEALDLCCVHPDLMRQSAMSARLAFLAQHKLEPSLSSPESLLQRVFSIAFKVDSGAVHQLFSVPALDVEGWLYDDCLRCFCQLPWEAPFLSKALHLLLERGEGIETMQICVGLMARGGRECVARRTASFCTIINMIPSSALPAADTGSDPLPLSPSLTGASQNVHEAVRRLHAACADAIDDLKDKAFKQAFLDPCELYVLATGDDGIGIDIDVHGASNFLALLQASVGVRLRRLPALNDESKGAADPVQAGLLDPLCALWGLPAPTASLPTAHTTDDKRKADKPAVREGMMTLRTGRGGGSARRERPPRRPEPRAPAIDRAELRARVLAKVANDRESLTLAAPGHEQGAAGTPRSHTLLTDGTHVWAALSSSSAQAIGHSHCFIWENRHPTTAYATQALDRQAANAGRRTHLATYLHVFFLNFTPARVLPLLTNLVTSNGDLCTAAQAIFEHMRADDQIHATAGGGPHAANSPIAEDCTDVRYWLWDLEATPAHLCAPAAARLLSAIGIVLDERVGRAAAGVKAPCGKHKSR